MQLKPIMLLCCCFWPVISLFLPKFCLDLCYLKITHCSDYCLACLMLVFVLVLFAYFANSCFFAAPDIGFMAFIAKCCMVIQ